jgi:hypothetical protein
MDEFFPLAREVDKRLVRNNAEAEVVDAYVAQAVRPPDMALAEGLLKGFKHLRRSKAKYLLKQPRERGRSRVKNYNLLAVQKVSREVRKIVRKKPWTAEEDAMLKDEITRLMEAKLRFNDWALYSVELFKGTRTPRECMRRAMDTLFPARNGEWNEEETKLLIEGVKRYGVGNWSTLLQNMELSRSSISCRDKWRRLVKNVSSRQNKPASDITADYLLGILYPLGGNTK